MASAGYVPSRRASAGRAVVVLISHAPRARADRVKDQAAVGDEVTLVVDGDLQLWQRPLGGAEDDLAVLRHVEGRLVARAQQVVGLLLVHRRGSRRQQDRSRRRCPGGPSSRCFWLSMRSSSSRMRMTAALAFSSRMCFSRYSGLAVRVGQQALGHDVEDRADGDVLGLTGVPSGSRIRRSVYRRRWPSL